MGDVDNVGVATGVRGRLRNGGRGMRNAPRARQHLSVRLPRRRRRQKQMRNGSQASLTRHVDVGESTCVRDCAIAYDSVRVAYTFAIKVDFVCSV